MSKPSSQIEVFSAQLLGKSLRLMEGRTIRTGVQDVTLSLYHSDRDVGLFIWKDQRTNIIKQQLQFHGQVVEWNIIEGTRTGVMIEEGYDPYGEANVIDMRHPQGGQAAIKYDKVRQPYTIEQVVEILRSIEGMSEAEKAQLIKNFAESPNFSDLKPEEVLSLYGRPNNWRNRLLAWFDRLVFLFQFGSKR